MRSTQPPQLPRWLLEHLGCSPNNSVILGDLDERYRNGRSRVWYWKQVAVAIVASFFQEVWSHKGLTLRAIITGWAVFFVSRRAFNLTSQLLMGLASWSRFWRHDWITIAVQAAEVVLSGVLAGWLIARVHRQNQKAMVFAYSAYFAVVQILRIILELLTEPLRYYPFTYSIAFIVMITGGVLFGGGVFNGRGDDRGPERDWEEQQ